MAQRQKQTGESSKIIVPFENSSPYLNKHRVRNGLIIYILKKRF